jgi:hypothetical protein
LSNCKEPVALLWHVCLCDTSRVQKEKERRKWVKDRCVDSTAWRCVEREQERRHALPERRHCWRALSKRMKCSVFFQPASTLWISWVAPMHRQTKCTAKTHRQNSFFKKRVPRQDHLVLLSPMLYSAATACPACMWLICALCTDAQSLAQYSLQCR